MARRVWRGGYRQVKKVLIFLAFLTLLCIPLHADENNVIFDTLMVNYIAMTWTDFTLTYTLFDKGGYEKNPLSSWYIEKPALAIAFLTIDNIIVNWGCRKLYKANKTVGILIIIAVNLSAERKNKYPDNIIDVLLSSIDIAINDNVRSDLKIADLVIEPALSEYSVTDTSKAKEIYAEGYRAAVFKIEKIKVSLANFEKSGDKHLFKRIIH